MALSRSAKWGRLRAQAGGVALILVGYLGSGIIITPPDAPAPAAPVAARGPGAPPLFQAPPPPPPAPPGTTAVVAAGTDDPVGVAQPVVTPFNQPQGRTLGRLRIPKMDLDVGYVSGVSDGPLRKGPGHWTQTPLPTFTGNAVLSGHRTTYTKPFNELGRLRRGDVVMVNAGRRPAIAYRVTQTLVVPEADYVEAVLPQPKDTSARLLTLFACHPEGSRTHRIVVRARATPVKARG